MAFNTRYSAIDKAVLIATGNSITLCGNTQQLVNNTATLVKPDGTTTLDWTEAGSTATLSVLDKSTILYAELIWYSTVSSIFPDSTDVQTTPDKITFITPATIYTNLAADYTENYIATSGSIHRYRAAVVTDKIKDAVVANNEGVYTISHVPTSISTTQLCDTVAGWTLVVVYRHDTFVPQRIVFKSGIVFTDSGVPIQSTSTGFTTPSSENDLKGRVFIACANGQPLVTGESLMVGSSYASLSPLGNPVGVGYPKPGTSPNNPYDNIFAGQINVCNPLSPNVGLLDITGSYGKINHNAFVPTQVNLARNKWDLASFDLISALEVNKSQVVLQYSQNAGAPGVEWIAIGSQVSASAPNITATLDGFDIDGDNQYHAEVGEPFTYAIQIKNLGNTVANNVIVASVLDAQNCTFISNSVKINGVTQIGANIATGVNIGSIAPTGVANILYQVRITNRPAGGLLKNNINYSYQFISGSGSPTYTNYATTNTLEIIIEQGKLSLVKSVPSPTSTVDGIINYTVTLANTGSQVCTDLIFQDKVSDAYCTFNPHSVYVAGLPKYDYDPNLGFALENLAPGETVTVTFESIVKGITPDSKVYNTAYTTYSYTYSQYPTPIKNTAVSNTTQVQLQYYDVIGYRINNNNYPNVGDIVTYTLTLTNIGNINASSIYVKEPPIAGTHFVTGSVVITPGTTPPGLNPFDGFYLPELMGPQATTTITYQVQIDQLQPSELIENIAQVPFKYQIQQEGPVINAEKDSNKVITRSNFVVITLPEAVDKGYATIDDILYYSVNLTNTGNVDAFNTIFQSTIQPDTLFIPGSVSINGIRQVSFNPNTGFSVGTIPPGDTINVTYSVRVLQVPNPNVIYNHSQLTYDYKPDPNGNHITNTIQSNTVQTLINKGSYTITKSVDKAYAQIGDYLIYTTVIRNTGTVNLMDVNFIDNIPVYVAFVPGTVYIDGVQYEEYDPNQGFTLTDIHPTEFYTIAFAVQVVSAPPTAVISNVSHVTLTYQVNPTSPIVTETAYSNSVLTNIMKGNVNVTKSVDKNYATVGDTITYTLLVANTGNILVTDVNLLDTVPGLVAHYKANSLYVNDIPDTVNNPNTGIPINSLTIGQVATVKFSIIVDAVPTPNTLTNVGIVNYKYSWNPEVPNVDKTATSNPVTTVINIGSLNLTKQVNKTYATVGDKLIYTILATNLGTVPLTDIYFIDFIQSNANFVPGSVEIDGVAMNQYVPYAGFTLANIAPGGERTITFQVTVNSAPLTPPTPSQINNTATVDYKYKINPSSSSILASQTSTQVTTYINKMTVTHTKAVDMAYATINDTLTYTSTIKNNGNVTITNTKYTDSMPTGMTFQVGTVKIDGQLTGFDPNTGFTLGDMIPGQTVVVEFKAKVSSLPSTGQYDNTANLTFSYKVNPLEPYIIDNALSNTVTTYIRTGNLIITKDNNRAEAMKGDTIRYSFILSNVGNTTLGNIIFRDPIQSPQSSFVTGSLYINGESTAYDPTGTGFTLPFDMIPSAYATIYFDVLVNSDPVAPATQYDLPNTGYVSYQYKINPSNPYILVTDQPSNTTTITIKKMLLLTTKTVSPSPSAAIGDAVTFTTTLYNGGSVNTTDVFFRDTLDSHIEFITGSVSIKVGAAAPINYPLANPEVGFYLPDPTKTKADSNTIASGQTVQVIFQVLVLSRPSNNIVYNAANVDYDFTIGTDSYHIETTTNTTQTHIAVGELAVTKLVDKAYGTVNDQLEYTINIANTGSVDATNINFRDPIPTNTNFVAGSIVIDGTPTAYTQADLIAGIPLTSLNPYQSHRVGFKVKVVSLPDTGEVTNTAHVDFSYQIKSQTYNDTKDSLPVTTRINLAKFTLTKVVDKAYATIGDHVLYTFSIKNEGNIPGCSIVFTDVIQANASFDPHSVYIDGTQQYTADPNVGFEVADIPGGTTRNVSFSVTVNTLPGDYLLNNTATTNYSYFIDPTKPYVQTSATSNQVTTRIQVGNLAVTKAVNLAYATLEDIIVYTVTVVNTGNINAVNVNFRDIIPTGLTLVPNSVKINGENRFNYDPYESFTLGTLTPGVSTTIIFSTTVTSVPNPSLIVNKAITTFSYRINPAGLDMYKEVDSNEVTTQINIGKLTITKSVDLAYATIGDRVTYSFIVTNAGNVDVTNVALTDAIQSEVSFNDGSVIINGGAPTSYNPAIGIPLGNITPLSSVTVLFTVTVKPNPVRASVLNFADGNFSYKIDPNGNTYTKSEQSNTVSTRLINPKMSSTKVVDLDYATLLDYLNYTIIISNTGNNTITDVFFKDFLGSGATFTAGSVTVNGDNWRTVDPTLGFSLPDIISGDIVNIQFKAQVTSIPTPPPQVNNYAITTGKCKIDPLGPSYDIAITTNTVSTTIHVGNINATKSVNLGYANVGDNLTYTTVLTNTGNVNATNVWFFDTLQREVTFIPGSVSIGGIIYSTLDPTVGFEIGTLAPTQSVTIEFDVKINSLPTTPQIDNRSQVEFSYKINPNGSTITKTNFSNTATTRVVLGQLTTQKVVDKGIATIGDELTYNLQIVNTGNVAALNVFFKDTPSTGATFKPGSVIITNGSSSTTPPLDPTVGFNLSDIAVGNIVTVTFVATVLSVPSTNKVTNQAVITFDHVVDPKEPVIHKTSSSNSVTTNIALGSLTVTKTVDKQFATIGEYLTYTVVVTNTGNINVTNVNFIDPTPLNSSFVLHSVYVNGTPQPNYYPAAGFLIGTMAAGQIVTVVYQVQVIS